MVCREQRNGQCKQEKCVLLIRTSDSDSTRLSGKKRNYCTAVYIYWLLFFPQAYLWHNNEAAVEWLESQMSSAVPNPISHRTLSVSGKTECSDKSKRKYTIYTIRNLASIGILYVLSSVIVQSIDV